MMPEQDDNAVVTYGVKELLAALREELSNGFVRLETALSGKADKADLAEIRGELKAHGEEIGRLKEKESEREAAAEAHTRILDRQTEWRRWAVPALLTAVMVIVMVLQLFGVT